MRNEIIKTYIHCDLCSRGGNPDYPNRRVRFFSITMVVNGRVTVGVHENGWWIGRKYDLCPKCRIAEKKQSRARRSTVINLKREAV